MIYDLRYTIYARRVLLLLRRRIHVPFACQRERGVWRVKL